MKCGFHEWHSYDMRTMIFFTHYTRVVKNIIGGNLIVSRLMNCQTNNDNNTLPNVYATKYKYIHICAVNLLLVFKTD